MQCGNCQAIVIDGSKYCNLCGKEIPIKLTQETAAKESAKKWHETGWVWFWLIIFWPIGTYGLIQRAKLEHQKWWWTGVGCLVFIAFFGPKSNTNSSPEPTRASQSSYNQNILAANTSYGLTKADLAWHAVNTYGWDCSEVLSASQQSGDYYVISCSNGTSLRVYPRSNQHPKITNMYGSYN